jgi:alkylation response protein AidB-like acyl-CoA dehydrogenase
MVLARGALEDSISYATSREQFGQSIAEFQAIRFKIAHMATGITAARQLMYRVCDSIDSGQRCDLEAGMVKYFASEIQVRIISDQLLGRPDQAR